MNKIVILDSNIIIYTGLREHSQLRNWLKSKRLFVSAISQLEVLGYHKLVSKDRRYFETFFKQCELVPIHHEIINAAISFRQQKKMSVGDSIIAATALYHKLPLISANIKDFKHLESLELIDPIKINL